MKADADFHFEELAFLARVDAQAFESSRRRIIGDVLAAAVEKDALAALQQRIDAIRVQAADPPEALLAIARLLDESVSLWHRRLKALASEPPAPAAPQDDG